MNAIKTARRLIQSKPDHPDALALTRLVLALESGEPFELSSLYELQMAHFELALEILREWRLDRYYARKAKLLDVSFQMQERAAHAGTPPA